MSHGAGGRGAAAVGSLAGLTVRLARAWWPQVATLALSSAVVTATITGSLGVGDGLQRGLRSLAAARLGGIRAAVLGEDVFRRSLADEIARGWSCESPSASGGGRIPAIVPAIVLEVTLEAGRASARSTLLACEDPTALGFGRHVPPGLGDVLVNEPLAGTLGLATDMPVVLRVPGRSSVPADSPLGRRSVAAASRRLRVSGVLPAAGLGGFSLRPTQVTGPLVVASLATVQAILGRGDVANAVLVVGADDADPEARLRAALQPKLADFGLALEPVGVGGETLRLTSRKLLLPAAVDVAADRVLGPRGGIPTLVFLATDIRPEGASGAPAAGVPYSTVLGIGTTSLPVGDLVDADGRLLPPPRDQEILIDRWLADDLAAQGRPVAVGDGLEVRCFQPETLHGRVEEASGRFRIAGIAEMRAAAVARETVPEVEGITDEPSIADWDPPFPFDRSRVRTVPPHDEDDRYWKQFGATPKAFVSLAAARRLAASRFGDSTAWLVPAAAAERDQLADRLAAAIPGESLGLRIVGLERQALAAARGSTPFGGLFLALSSFVVIAGMILHWLLFGLLVAAHRPEIGLLAAIGWSPRRLARLLVAIGAIAAVGGTAIGFLWGRAWGGLLVTLLGTAWDADVVRGSSSLFAVAGPAWSALWPGAVAGLVISLVALARAAARVARAAPLALLRNRAEPVPGRWWRWPGRPRTVRSLAGLAWRSLAHRPGRAVAITAIVGLAQGLVVAVSAFTLTPPVNLADRRSPTGGWTTIVRFGEPTGVDPADAAARPTLGMTEAEEAVVARAGIVRLRSSGGDDASCTNLYAAGEPTVIGVGEDFIARGGFTFSSRSPTAGTNPWRMLSAPRPPGAAVPAILDEATALWGLKLGGTGARFPIRAGTGTSVECEIVGLLAPGILQGFVIVGEQDFERSFPARSGYGMALVDATGVPPADRPLLRRGLAAAWADAAVDFQDATTRLGRLQAVQNIFLAAFQALGTLGLFLGTVGVAAAQAQGVIERAPAFAVLRAVGFSLARIRRLVVIETLWTVGLGLVIGTVAGLSALLPASAAARPEVPWRWALASALAALAAASLATLVAVSGVVIPRRPRGS